MGIGDASGLIANRKALEQKQIKIIGIDTDKKKIEQGEVAFMNIIFPKLSETNTFVTYDLLMGFSILLEKHFLQAKFGLIFLLTLIQISFKFAR